MKFQVIVLFKVADDFPSASVYLSNSANRLPVLQASSPLYLLGNQALMSTEEWRCPDTTMQANGLYTLTSTCRGH